MSGGRNAREIAAAEELRLMSIGKPPANAAVRAQITRALGMSAPVAGTTHDYKRRLAAIEMGEIV
jgi:hypothetical protein